MGVKIDNKSSALAHDAGKIVEMLPGGMSLARSVEMLVAWGRANSLWPLLYGTSCCAIEMMSTGAARHDWARFGVEVARASARQADMIILAGTVVEKMAENLITLYEQMPAPKYVIAMGSCSISGGPFYYDSYSVVKGADRLIPVDVYIPGCPPRPEALFYGIMQLQEKIKKEGRNIPWSLNDLVKGPFLDTFTEDKKEWDALEAKKDQEMAAAREQFKIDNPDYKPPKPVRPKKEKFPSPAPRAQAPQGVSNWTMLQTLQGKFPAITVQDHPKATPKQVAELGTGYTLDMVVPKEQYREVMEYLKENEELSLEMFIQLTCVDWKEYFDVVVHLLSVKGGHKLFLRCRVEKDEAGGGEIDTISDLYAGADWHEREVYDMYGVRFTNHPDMRRIYLKNDFPGHPLRKDFEDPTRVVKRPY
ncbi:MAG: NADH-quinone oxidoreductase subunit NuoB [Candidatus Electrothrix aestuarii]|uniref:NADH-quinone oxidoreductase subunit B n=1 Tax=Candidatus Electrothrix aestuarii TaxID=3062594 RepID=A0AAU8LRV9_9BACT